MPKGAQPSEPALLEDCCHRLTQISNIGLLGGDPNASGAEQRDACRKEKLQRRFPKSPATFKTVCFDHRNTSFYCAVQTSQFLQIEGLWQPCIEQVYRLG